MDSYTQYLIICPLLFLGGFVDSIAGGGGLITLPAYLLAGLPPHLALGTNKFSSAIGTSISTARLALNGFIKLRPALICIVCAFIGSSIGSRLTLLISDEIFNKLLLIVLPIAAFYVMRNKGLSEDPNSYVDKTDNRTPLRIAVIAFFIGGYRLGLDRCTKCSRADESCQPDFQHCGADHFHPQRQCGLSTGPGRCRVQLHRSVYRSRHGADQGQQNR